MATTKRTPSSSQVFFSKSTPQISGMAAYVKQFSEFTGKEVSQLLRRYKLNEGLSWGAAVKRVREECGDHRHLGYIVARSIHVRKMRAEKRAFLKAQHEENQKIWFEEGGRVRKYLENHGVYGGDHAFLRRALWRETGCYVESAEAAIDGFQEEMWLQEAELGLLEPEVPRRPKPTRCEGCQYTPCIYGDYEYCPKLVSGGEWEFAAKLPRGINLALLRLLRAKIAELVERRSRFVPSRLRAHLCSRRIKTSVLLRGGKLARTGHGAYQPVRISPTDGVIRRTFPQPDLIYPQSEGVISGDTTQVSTSNVVLTEDNPSSSTVASNKRFDFTWHKLCSTEPNQDYEYLTDRFTYFKSVEWKSSMTQNSRITDFSLDLPKDFIDKSDGSMPMFVPFKIHRYFKSDIEIKIHVNSNKFQVGQLQFSWMYMHKYNGTVEDTMYNCSQRPHVLVNAGSSNEATLYIPYKYVQPYMYTSQRKGNLLEKYLGSLRCNVVVPLATGPNGPASCTVSMFIRLPNAEFTGMVDGGIAFPQMEAAAAAMVAGAVYDKFIGDKNCDNVSNNVNPNYVIPTASHNWSAGTGLVEHVHSLRLDNTTKGVGRQGIDNSETSIGIPCRTFGMLLPFEWSIQSDSANTPGTQLWSCDAHAQLEKKKFDFIRQSGLDVYAVPPVSVVAGCFKYWRGSLEFKFDIIASAFHTGRLLVAYIPGFYGDSSKITLAQARNCPHATFSIGEATSFTFVVPYISNSVWWPRKYTGPHKLGELAAPSKIIMFILNPLVVMQDIVDKVTIVPYVRAGEDFEVSVPVQPSNGLADSTEINLPIRSKLKPLSGSFYGGKLDAFSPTKMLLKVGDDPCHFELPNISVDPSTQAPFFKFEDQTKCGLITYNTVDPTTKQVVTGRDYVSYCVYIEKFGTLSKFCVPYPRAFKQWGIALAKGIAAGKELKDLQQYLLDFVSPDTAAVADITKLYATYETTNVEADDFEFLPEMDPRSTASDLLVPTSLLPSTSGGVFNFNENFSDLKTLCRRYQLYGEVVFKIPKDYDSDDAVGIIPIYPRGLDVSIKDDSSTSNICREGHIPLVASGYTYFRGSLRFRIVLASDNLNIQGAKVWLQHHPDGKVFPPSIQLIKAASKADAIQSHTYAFYIQSMGVNSIIEFEIPFYQNGMYGLAYHTLSPTQIGDRVDSADLYYTLGNISIGFFAGKINSAVDVHAKVYYSFSDDMSLSTFQGFPLMTYTDEVWFEPQMEDARIEDQGTPEMLGWVSDYFMNKAEDVVRTSAYRIANKIVEDIKITINEARAEIAQQEEIEFKILNSGAVLSAFGNFVHILANPTPKTVAISVCNILVNILGQNVVKAIKLMTKMTSYLAAVWHKFLPPNEAVPQGPGDEQDKLNKSLCGLILSGVAMLFGVCSPTISSCPDFIKGINSNVSFVNNVTRFVQNCGDVIMWAINCLTDSMYPELSVYVKLLKDVPEISKWFEEASYLLDCRNRTAFLHSNKMVNRVFDAVTLGNLIVSSGINQSHPGGKVVWDTLKELKKIQSDLYEKGVHPDVRFEPFPVWFTGEPGIGKSYSVTKMANDLLTHIDYTQRGSLIYYVQAGAKYWNGCDNPAVIVSDDLFQVSGQTLEEEIKTIFSICSSSVLNPPMAAVEEKNKRINPLIYFMLCNSAFPAIAPVSKTPEAVFRRRKFLIMCELKQELREKYPNFKDASDLTERERSGGDHLRYKYALNVKSVTAASHDSGWSEQLTYRELMAILKPAFMDHYMNERANFRARMDFMYSRDPTYNPDDAVTQLPEIQNQTSLATQMEMTREILTRRLDEINDPQRRKSYMEQFGIKVKDVKQKVKSYITGEVEPQMGKKASDDWENVIAKALADGENPLEAIKQQVLLEHATEERREKFWGPEEQMYERLGPLLTTHVKDFVDFHVKFMLPHNMLVKALDATDPNALLRSLIMNYKVFQTEQTTRALAYDCKRFLYKFIGFGFDTMAKDRFTTFTDAGSFDAVEYLKFIAVFDMSAAPLYDLIFSSDAHNNEYPSCISGVREMEENTSDCVHDIPSCLKNSKLLMNKAQHHPFRKAIQTCFNSEELPRTKFRRFMEKFFSDSTVFAQCGWYTDDAIPEPVKEYQAKLSNKVWNSHSEVANELTDMFNLSIKISDCLDERQSHNWFRYTMRFASVICMGEWLYQPFSVPLPRAFCGCTSTLVTLYNRNEFDSYTYCSIRNRLVFDNIEVPQCKNSSCQYSSDFFYYMCCMGAISCNKLVVATCNGSDEAHESGSPATDTEITSLRISHLSYVDIERAIRRERRKRDKRWLDKFVNYGKHLLKHTLPKAVMSILFFLLLHLPKIILAIGAWKLMGAFGIQPNIGAFIANVGATVASSAIGSYFVSPPQSEPQGNYFRFDQAKHHKVPNATINKEFIQPQSSAANNKSLSNKIIRNFVRLHVSWIDEDNKRETRGCDCLMIKGRAMLVIRHYLEEYKFLQDQGFKIECSLLYAQGKQNKTCSVSVPFQEILDNVAWCSGDGVNLTSNFGMVIVPQFTILFPDISKYIAPREHHKNLPTLCDQYCLGGNHSFNMHVEVVPQVRVAATPTSRAVVTEIGYKYQRQSKGMCGSVLVAPTLGSGFGAIVGMHVAGSPVLGVGFSEPLYRDMFDKYFEVAPQKEVLPIPTVELPPDFELDSNLVTYGVVDPKFAHKESGKSKIVPSMLYDEIYEHKTEPNPLKPNDPRQPPGSHPLRDGCNKHGTGSVFCYEPQMVDEVKVALSERLNNVIVPVRAKVSVLTDQQAVCGDVNVPYFESVNWKSSEGFPLVADRPPSAHNKKWLFDLTLGEFGYKLDKIHDKLANLMRVRDACFKRNISPNTVYIDCLKDYRLTFKKCAEPGKTRIFSVAPIQCSLDIRKHCTDFTAAVKKSRIHNSIGIGINPDSHEWTELVSYLFEVGDKIITLDYKNFGPSLMSQLVAASNELIVDWHKFHEAEEEHVKRVEWLLDCDILNPVHLSSNVLYQTVNGIASGSPLTGECNSIPNLFYLALTFLEIMNENCKTFASMYYFNHLVRVVVYGDDLIMCVHDSIIDVYNALTIKYYLGRHGITVTPAIKDAELEPYTSIYRASFLKRSFIEHPFRNGIWLAPIEKQSIEECLNWCHASENIQEATLECCRASLDLAYSQGPKYYNEHKGKILKALSKLGLSLNIKSWHQRDREIFDGSPDDKKLTFENSLPWYYHLE